METKKTQSQFTHTHTERGQSVFGEEGFWQKKQQHKNKQTKKAVLTCSHWVRYCHSDKSHYDSPFLLTCGGGRNRAVSPKTKRSSKLADSWGGEWWDDCSFSHRLAWRRSSGSMCPVTAYLTSKLRLCGSCFSESERMKRLKRETSLQFH